MPTQAAHECASGVEVEQWHDEAFAEYQAALDAYSDDIASRRSSGDGSGFDEDLRAAYEEARDNLVAGTQYWRQVGEQVGTRQGLAIVNNVIEPEDEGDSE